MSNLDNAFNETKELFKQYMRCKTDKKLFKYVQIEKDMRCDAIDIFVYDYCSYEFMKIAEKVLQKYHVQHLVEDIDISAIALEDKHTRLRIRLCLAIKHI